MHSPVDTSLLRPSVSVASITVTYNGAAAIRLHLESLRAQTCRLAEIIVVDNASTDNTRQLVEAEFPEVTFIHLPDNVGVAGGLAAGLKCAALTKRYDWVWTFDQDSMPAPDALAQLLSAFENSGQDDSLAMVAPVCRHTETGMSYPALVWRGYRFALSEPSPTCDVGFVDMVISSGSLIRSSAVTEVGLPNEDFFIDFVDYEYCLRLRKHGFRIAVVRKAILEHSIGSPTTFTIFGRKTSWADHDPWREYYMTRNEIFTIWRHRPRLATKLFVLHRLAHHAIGIILFGKQKSACLRMIARGTFDGLAGRLGIRYLPHQSKPRKSAAPPLRSASFPRKAQ